VSARSILKDRRVRHNVVVRWREGLPKGRDERWYLMTDLRVGVGVGMTRWLQWGHGDGAVEDGRFQIIWNSAGKDSNGATATEPRKTRCRS
jgi:hypothetical protein